MGKVGLGGLGRSGKGGLSGPHRVGGARAERAQALHLRQLLRVWEIAPGCQSGAPRGSCLSEIAPPTPGPWQPAGSRELCPLPLTLNYSLRVRKLRPGASREGLPGDPGVWRRPIVAEAPGPSFPARR